MKKHLKLLQMYLTLPEQGKKSVIVTVKALSEFYEGMYDKTNNTDCKKTSPQRRQKFRAETDRQYQHDIAREENTDRFGA